MLLSRNKQKSIEQTPITLVSKKEPQQHVYVTGTSQVLLHLLDLYQWPLKEESASIDMCVHVHAKRCNNDSLDVTHTKLNGIHQTEEKILQSTESGKPFELNNLQLAVDLQLLD